MDTRGFSADEARDAVEGARDHDAGNSSSQANDRREVSKHALYEAYCVWLSGPLQVCRVLQLPSEGVLYQYDGSKGGAE